MRSLAVSLAMLTLAGCQLYFNGDDEPCATNGGGYVDGYPSNELRNPETGDCQDFSYPPPGGGCDSCGNCDDRASLPIAPPPLWPQCHSQCDSLGEDACIAESGCQAAYWENTDYQDAPSVTTFRGCYATVTNAPFGLVDGCWELDAQSCAQYDQCSLFYAVGGALPPGGPEDEPTDALGYSRFSRCAPEPTNAGCAAVDCGPGYHCEESCYPTPGVPEMDCGGTGPGGKTDCGTQCAPMCVPDNQYGCAAIDCGPGYQCVETCDAADPTTSGDCFPGQCYATCQPTTACETILDEATCNTRGDCTSVFTGDDCTCYPGGYCECAVLTWDRCETLGVVPMPL